MASKIAVIGVGAVGTVAAQKILEKGLASQLVLVDVAKEMVKGKALDLSHSAALQEIDCKVSAAGDFKAIKKARVVIVTAGFPRKKGMLREQLLDQNLAVVKLVAKQVKKHAPQAVVLLATNPLDLMTFAFLEFSGFKPKKVVGMAGGLDSARFKHYLAEEAKVGFKSVKAMVIGGHAANLMVPLTRLAKVKGKPAEKRLGQKKIKLVVERTRKAGAMIADYFGSGTAFLCPGEVIAQMVESIVKDKNQVFPSSVLLKGEYGLKGLCLGVPVKLGRQGVAGIVELKLDREEKARLEEAASSLKQKLSALKLSKP
jgi:malate dehydrogenase